MKKVLALLMVFVLAGVAKGAISFSPVDAAAFDNVPIEKSQVIGIGIQNEDGSVDYIYLGHTNLGRQHACCDILRLFPDVTTVTGLLLIGLQAKRRHI